MEKADRQKIIMVGLLTVILGYFGYAGIGAFAGVSGLREAAAKLQKERDELQQQVQNAQMLVANLGTIKKEREALEVQLSDLAKRLPAEHESAQVLRSVELLAGKSGLVVAQVKRRPNRSQELYVEIPMEVMVGGGYHDLLKFADQLAQLPRLVTLNEVRVERRQAGAASGGVAAAADTPGTVRAQVVAVVFQALPQGAPAGTARP